MPVAEIFLSAFIQVLLDRLASRQLLEFAARQGIRPRLDKLEANLKMITQVIAHADAMPVREKGVNEWLEDLRDWAYHADDFLDEVNTRAMQEEARRNNTSSSVSVSSCSLAIVTKVRDVVFGFISGKHSKGVDELNSRLDAISQRMDEMRRLMKMTTGTDNTSTTPLAISQRPSEAPADEFDARVYGREQEKERIIEQLKNGRDANVEVISIVGMPGLGKTTLARHVFDSVSVQQQKQQEAPLFDIKGWVCVSDDFDVIRITRDILESFNFRPSDSSGLNKLQSQLKEVVGGKRFLLVLDDVWTRNYVDDWSTLRSPFRVGAPGSKILVTTRDDRVASMMQTVDPMKIHHPGLLGNDDCWSVFLQHVTDKGNSDFESEAGRFREKILGKCKGLPLTAKLLAGLLRGESPGQGWEATLNSSIWDLSENELSGKGYRMLPVVMLSYFHLPSPLKRCFSYCSVLLKDYEFEEEEVVLMWMAQGLIFSERGEQLEVTAAKYFRELVSRSLFQRSPNNPSGFLMHDLIHDMAEIVAGKSCFKFDGDLKTVCRNPEQARYSSFCRVRLEMEFETYERTKYLRAIQSFDLNVRKHWESDLTSYVPLKLLMKLKYLRVLCLSWYSVRELPKDIGDLIHLRLVDLSHTKIRRLPESISNLYNLQELKLRGCDRLRTLPAQMRKLVNLRNLDCSGSFKLAAMPVEMGKLTSLQKLSNFIVGERLEQGIGQLKHLSHLKGSISISCLENVRDSKEAREAELGCKESLQSLHLQWSSYHSSHLLGTDVSSHVLEELQPHKHLEKLIISEYGGLSFPSWVGDDRFSKMRVIMLAYCESCTSLPPLGKLPALEEIQIRHMTGIQRVGEEFYGKERGGFPLLKILKFASMANWSTWSYPAGGGCGFDCLQELHVINCPKLSMSLPNGPNLQRLEVRRCDKLQVALPRQAILEMDIRECKVGLSDIVKEDGDASQLLPSVSSLYIEKVDVVEAVESARMRMNIIRNKDVVEAHHQLMMLGSLTALEMASIPKLAYLPGAVLQGMSKLEKLRICRCEDLTSLWRMDDGEMEIRGRLILQQNQKSHFLNSLRQLEVKECCQLVCLVPEDDTDGDTDIICEEKEGEKRGKQPQYRGLPCGLEILSLTKCDKLEKLPSDLHNLTSLRRLGICECRRLSCLPEMGFPSTLESLFITACESLTCLSMGGNGMPLPHSLKWLYIWNCENLVSLVSTDFTSADSLPSPLESVEIRNCPKLKSLPEGIINRHILRNLAITGCENLGELSIPVHHLTALRILCIEGWPAGLHSIQQGGPNPNSLPPNLDDLTIEGGAGHSVTPNDEVFSVPLPSSLTSLRIYKFKKLSPEAFQNLTSLDYLQIKGCPGLTSIPDQLLPPSIRSLRIRGCPLLASELAKRKGRYWPKVKFIPRVEIDGRSIFDPEEKRRGKAESTSIQTAIEEEPRRIIKAFSFI